MNVCRAFGYSIGIAEDAVRERGRRKELVRKVNVLELEKKGLSEELNKLKSAGDSLAAEEKSALETEIQKLQTQFAEERLKLESQLREVVNSKEALRLKVDNAECRLIVSGRKMDELQSEKSKVDQELLAVMDGRDEARRDAEKAQAELSAVVEEFSGLKKAYDILGERFDCSEKEVDDLKWKLEVAPSRDVIIDEFQRSSEMQKMLNDFGDAVVADFMDSVTYKTKLDDAVKQFMKSSEFRRAVGEKTGAMIPYVVECCRVFLKDDLQRPRDGFETFFVDWKKKVNEEKARNRLAGEVDAGKIGTSSS